MRLRGTRGKRSQLPPPLCPWFQNSTGDHATSNIRFITAKDNTDECLSLGRIAALFSDSCNMFVCPKHAVQDAAVPVFTSNSTSSSVEDSRDNGWLMFSRLPGLSSDVINDVFHQLPASASVSVSADAVACYLLYIRGSLYLSLKPKSKTLVLEQKSGLRLN